MQVNLGKITFSESDVFADVVSEDALKDTVMYASMYLDTYTTLPGTYDVYRLHNGRYLAVAVGDDTWSGEE